MSRLDSAIRRLQAQRACLDAAITTIGDRPGLVLELGLGNGRTYDHLREALPDREIFVFERDVRAHPDCIPDADHLFLGDIRETLTQAAARIGGRAILVHSDIGTGVPARNAALASTISQLLPGLLAPGAVIISDQELSLADADILDPPDGVEAGRYFLSQWGL